MKYILIMIMSITFLFGEGLSLEKKDSDTNKEKIIYKDMISYLKNSNDANQFIVLGSLYANGTEEKDALGQKIEIDIFLAEKYLLKSAEMGNIRALSVLGGLILIKEEMRKLDPKLIKAEHYLTTAFKNGDFQAGTILSDLYFEKNDNEKAIAILFESAEGHDSNAELGLAILFQKGLIKNNKRIIKRDSNLAIMYLNRACKNENKSEKVIKICKDPKYVLPMQE